jgi:integrase
MKPSSAKKIIEILVGCFKYAKRMKLITVLPTDIEKFKMEKPKIEYWTIDQIEYFLKEIKDSYLYTPVLIAILTGVRVAELCGIRWCDVHLDEGYIHLTIQILYDRINRLLIHSTSLKTDTSHRDIFIPNILINLLRHLKSEGKPSETDYVITNRSGCVCNPRNISMEFTKKVTKYKDSIEKKKATLSPDELANYMQLPQISFHGLRHSHATILILNGENIKVVSDRLGHKDISVTLNTYIHVMEDMKKESAQLLNNIFKNTI